MRSRRRVPLPTYAFQRDRHWIDTAPVGEDEAPVASPRIRVESEPLDEREPAGEPARGSFAAQIAALPEQDRRNAVLEEVLMQAAVVLGHSSTDAIDPNRTFKELGFDSPATVELRNRLVASTGLRLLASLVFDHPTPGRLADTLLAKATGEPALDTQVQAGGRIVEEPIAIFGIACRYPGGVRSAGGPLEVGRGRGGRDRGVPRRIAAGTSTGCSTPTRSRPGTSSVRHGGFLYDAAEFDAEPSPGSRRARRWRWTHSSGCCWSAPGRRWRTPASIRSLRGSLTGVFAGAVRPRLRPAPGRGGPRPRTGTP